MLLVQVMHKMRDTYPPHHNPQHQEAMGAGVGGASGSAPAGAPNANSHAGAGGQQSAAGVGAKRGVGGAAAQQAAQAKKARN